jgi:hypothetical protein
VGSLVVTLFFQLADIVTDGIACSRLLHGDVSVAATKTYTVVYIVLLCLGVVATGVSVVYRLRNARLMNSSLKELAQISARFTESDSELQRQKSKDQLGGRQQHDFRRQAQQHEWELAQTHRTKVATTLEVLSILLQGACAVVRHC